MSHFIQDNQVVITTVDNKILLFTKGGDNNTFSNENKRCTKWHFFGTFSDNANYQEFITELMMSDISGGSWQFASLKNKSFHGYTEYENVVYKRFFKALKNALKSSWRLSEVTTDNIYEFENELMNLFREKNISLKNESGIESGLGIVSKYGNEVRSKLDAIELLNNTRSYDRKGSELYKEFCEKYKDSKLEELAQNISFCTQIVKIKKNWGNSISILESLKDEIKAKDLHFSCFNTLTNWDEDTVEYLLNSYNIEYLVSIFPRQFETLNCLSVFHSRSKSIIDKADGDYLTKKVEDNYNLIINADYKALKIAQDVKIEKLLSKAKDNFIEVWNNLIASCYYKRTNDKLPRLISNLSDSLSTNTFTLEDVKNDCEDDFTKVLSHHHHQYKKNQTVIKKVFKELIHEYTVLFNEKSIDALCEYFGFEKPIKELSKPIIVEKVEKIVQVNKTTKTQLTLFDFAS